MLNHGRLRRPHLRRGRARSRGQAVVEFALILPVFLVLTLGVVDMARLFTSYISLTNGVSSGALYAGSGGYAKWCASDIAISHTAACANAARFNASPDNIAYQIQIESTGLNLSTVVMADPVCKLAASPFTVVDCATLSASSDYTVRVSATYAFTFLTPIVSNVTGAITMTASTSAAVLH